MKVFYHCYGGTHSSVVTAAIHLGMLPMDRIPKPEQILSIPRFDRVSTKELGEPYLMGEDEYGNGVFAIGFGPQKAMLTNVMESMTAVLGLDSSELLFVDTLPYVDVSARIGGFLSRRLGLVNLGRPLVVKGILKRYPMFSKLARESKQRARRMLDAPR